MDACPLVGPRPERPEIIAQLAQQVPFYEERLMVQLRHYRMGPGISYPYGASAPSMPAANSSDDLYYMKHMSLFLDVFILLDTVRTVLTGGAKPNVRAATTDESIQEWERLKEQPADPSKPKLELETA